MLQKYVEIGQEYGMKNMLYIPWGNTSYVDTDHGITPEMLLFPTAADATAHNVKSVPATLTGGEGQWARYSLMKANPSSSEFKNMLFTSAKKALQAIGFDGIHIDTLGPNYGGVYTVDGAEYSNDFAASNGMPNFINDAATFFNTDTWMKQGQNIRMSFNNVGSWGISALANNQNIDYLYSEQWPDMGNKTYNDMFNHVKDIIVADDEWPLDNSKIIIVKDGEIIDVKEEAEENTEEPVTETEVVVGTEMAEVTETEVVAEVETTNKEELGSEVVDTIKLINDLETKLQELYAKFDALMTSVNEMSDKVDKKTTEYDAKFSRVKTVEPLTKNEFEEPTKKFDSPYLGSYEDYKNRKK